MDYEEDCCELCNFAFCIVTPSTFQYTHETDQSAMCIQTESHLQCTLLVSLIAVKFSAWIVVIHLIALYIRVNSLQTRIAHM